MNFFNSIVYVYKCTLQKDAYVFVDKFLQNCI